MSIRRITFRRLDLPLVKPYRLSYRTFRNFEPYLIEVEDDAGRIATGDAHISPGSSAETREGGLAYLQDRLPQLVGLDLAEAKALMLRDFTQSKVATTAVVTALEQLEGLALLRPAAPASLPLLMPVGSTDQAAIEAEVEDLVARGFATLKIKVGKDVAADITRMGWIQKAVAGRARLRVDANRAYDRAQAIEFVRGIDPEGVVLFEQPCEADLWDDNAAVAQASDIPLMLDEPICTDDDIDRAAGIKGVGFCKLKLKRFGGAERLHSGIRRVQDSGMQAVLGDGLGSDLHAWLEGCVAAACLDNAGEFNGYLKLEQGILADPLPCVDGSMQLPAGPAPAIDRARLDATTTLTFTYQ